MTQSQNFENDYTSSQTFWHARYAQQAKWTEALRQYVFGRLQWDASARLLEVGCGTGAILERMHTSVYGLDLRLGSLQVAQVNAPTSLLTCGDAVALPYADNRFDAVFCHFLLLWLPDPQAALAEMMRVTRPNGHIIAFAEPDYTQRVDKPIALAPLGVWQRDALQTQGADVGIGGKLTELFHSAGTQIVETGSLSTSTSDTVNLKAWRLEWAVLEADLAGSIPESDIQKMKALDLHAWQSGERVLHVPTYYLWARMPGG